MWITLKLFFISMKCFMSRHQWDPVLWLKAVHWQTRLVGWMSTKTTFNIRGIPMCLGLETVQTCPQPKRPLQLVSKYCVISLTIAPSTQQHWKASYYCRQSIYVCLVLSSGIVLHNFLFTQDYKSHALSYKACNVESLVITIRQIVSLSQFTFVCVPLCLPKKCFACDTNTWWKSLTLCG